MLKVENLKKVFRTEEIETIALNGVTFEVKEGEFVAVMGPSGCGKSTLLRQLKPALAPHGTRQGRILFRDTPLDRVDQLSLIHI